LKPDLLKNPENRPNFFSIRLAKKIKKISRAPWLAEAARRVTPAGEQSMSKRYAYRGTPCTAHARTPDRWDRHRQRQADA